MTIIGFVNCFIQNDSTHISQYSLQNTLFICSDNKNRDEYAHLHMKCYLQLCKNVHIGIQSDPNQNITEKLYYYISEDWFRE